MTENTNVDKPTEEVVLTQEQRDAAAAEKYRAQLGDTGNLEATNADKGDKVVEKPARPEHIPEKFWDAEKGEVDVEAMAKSYSELEKAKSKAPEKGAEGDGKTGEEGGDASDADKSALAEFASLREQATAKLTAGEELTDEMYAGFEKRGLSREDVNAFIAGQEALGKLAAMDVHALAGGEAAYKSMIEWARTTYSAEEVAAYDRDVHSLDKAVRDNAVNGLVARHAQANGRSGKDVTDGGARGTAGGYASGAEMRKDMADPRYAKDAAFREEVARKVAGARAAGVDLRL